MRFLAVLLSLSLAGTAQATGCRVIRSTYVAPTYVAPTYENVVVEKVREIAVATYIPVAVAVPTYAVGYAAPAYAPAAYPTATPAVQAAPAQTPCEDKLAALESRLRALEGGRATGTAAASGPSPVANAAPVPAPAQATAQATAQAPAGNVLGVFQAKCARCHTQETKGKGNGFVLLQGQGVVNLTDLQAKDLWNRCRTGNMPKDDKLTEAEFDVITEWFASHGGKK